MKKVMLVFGTRPEAIKMCPLVKEFQKYPEEFETIVCVTGQHREMLDQVLRIFEVKPDYDLNIMKQGQDLYDVTARVLTGMRSVVHHIEDGAHLVPANNGFQLGGIDGLVGIVLQRGYIELDQLASLFFQRHFGKHTLHLGLNGFVGGNGGRSFR